ncbi:SIMPL domain-containing protein [Alteraurantiacibacter aquimixticola]|uniref:DUF541 domain-containing protein n=1 Tax=Alteraurantiacibacter aquimixticola TaxID=2489173 RepID=A0A4T3F3R1_9SPHN|nr:SIMPL domain-containing protein [Alteraurantiacibacter aquimixticola]TIX51916.1 DUF541 domain-containing protein [Alteraurantiacibacter aquimixticola]
MKNIALPLAAAAMALPASAAQAAEVQIAVEGPVVELSVTESVASDPDIADISAGVTTQASTAVEAMRLNTQAMNRVIAQIEAEGVDRDDIQTSGISLNAEYDYDQRAQQQVFRGYRVSNRVSVTLRDIDRTGEVLDALVAAGATDLGGISWSVDDASAAREQARDTAFANAREQALTYARMAGYADIRLLEVSENVQAGYPMPMVQRASLDMAEKSTPVVPGQVQSSVTVSVKYEMTR